MNEITALELHIELWTRIRNTWQMMDYFELYAIKSAIVQEMTPDASVLNNCYLCEYYLDLGCEKCPLHVDKELQCHPNYYELSYNGYESDYIEEIIDLARARLDKINLARNDIGEDSKC